MLLIKRVLIIIFFTTSVFAHGCHKKKKEVQIYDTLTIVNGDTIAIIITFILVSLAGLYGGVIAH